VTSLFDDGKGARNLSGDDPKQQPHNSGGVAFKNRRPRTKASESAIKTKPAFENYFPPRNRWLLASLGIPYDFPNIRQQLLSIINNAILDRVFHTTHAGRLVIVAQLEVAGAVENFEIG